jgi:hypothetical protein
MVNPDMRFNPTPPRSSSPDGLGRPSGDQSRTKSFEKVMKREERGAKSQDQDDDKVKEKQGDDVAEDIDDAASKGKEKPMNIFEMSSKKPAVQQFPPEATDVPNEELLVEMAENKMLSGKDKTKPEELYQQQKSVVPPKTAAQPTNVDAKNTEAEQLSAAYTRETEVANKDSKNQEQPRTSSDKSKKVTTDDRGFAIETEHPSKSKEKNPSDFGRDQPDASRLSSLAQAQQQQPLVNPMGDAKQAEAPRPATQLKELVDQIVKEMYVVKTGDVTDTVITIRHPPMFEGAQIKVTSFESARGEFNIAFENLSQQAKEILDSRVNRESLLLALNKEGYNVHIMTTSTQAAGPLYTAQAEQRDQERQQQGQGQGQEQQQQQQQKKKG